MMKKKNGIDTNKNIIYMEYGNTSPYIYAQRFCQKNILPQKVTSIKTKKLFCTENITKFQPFMENTEIIFK